MMPHFIPTTWSPFLLADLCIQLPPWHFKQHLQNQILDFLPKFFSPQSSPYYSVASIFFQFHKTKTLGAMSHHEEAAEPSDWQLNSRARLLVWIRIQDLSCASFRHKQVIDSLSILISSSINEENNNFC